MMAPYGSAGVAGVVVTPLSRTHVKTSQKLITIIIHNIRIQI